MTKAYLNTEDQKIELNIKESTQGPGAMDVTKLYGESGKFTYDPAFMSTASCESKLTFIDGEKGVLQHGGYKIEELANQGTFLEISYLLLYGELPKQQEKDAFESSIKEHNFIHEKTQKIFAAFAPDAHPMAMLISAMSSLAAIYHDDFDFNDPAHRDLVTHRVIAKIPTLVAMTYQHSLGQEFVQPDNNLDYTSNFLKMMFTKPGQAYQVNDVFAQAMDKIFILHADHEQNASTSYSKVSFGFIRMQTLLHVLGSGIACLWGPAHGGANEAVI